MTTAADPDHLVVRLRILLRAEIGSMLGVVCPVRSVAVGEVLGLPTFANVHILFRKVHLVRLILSFGLGHLQAVASATLGASRALFLGRGRMRETKETKDEGEKVETSACIHFIRSACMDNLMW